MRCAHQARSFNVWCSWLEAVRSGQCQLDEAGRVAACQAVTAVLVQRVPHPSSTSLPRS